MNFQQYLRRLGHFNHGEFFEAHEVLEDVWRAAPGPEKKFLQGLIQVAVALYHHGKGNLVGARSVMKRARRNLSTYPEYFGQIHLPPLLRSLAEWQQAMDEGRAVPRPPKIVVGHPASAKQRFQSATDRGKPEVRRER